MSRESQVRTQPRLFSFLQILQMTNCILSNSSINERLYEAERKLRKQNEFISQLRRQDKEMMKYANKRFDQLWDKINETNNAQADVNKKMHKLTK